MNDIIIPMGSDHRGHDMQDDCAEWAQSNVRPFIAQGCDQQGRHHPTIPAEACTELGADQPRRARLGGVGRRQCWLIKHGGTVALVIALVGAAVLGWVR